MLHTQRLLARVDVAALQDLMAAGLERAAAVAGLWHRALSLSEDGTGLSAGELLMDPGALRA